MSIPTLWCTTHFVEDAHYIWATKKFAENGRLFSIAIWYMYTPENNCALTMSEVALVIESDIEIRVGSSVVLINHN